MNTNQDIPMVQNKERQIQMDMLSATDCGIPLMKAPENFLPFIGNSGFTAEQEEAIRILTNPNGRGNAAYDMDKERAMPAQDTLVRMWGWFHGTTGFSCMFKWASGRQDAYVELDTPNPSPETITRRAALVARFTNMIEQAKKEQLYVN